MDKEHMSKDSWIYFPYFDSIVSLTEYFNKNKSTYSIQYQSSESIGQFGTQHDIKWIVIICVTNGRKMLHSPLVNGLLIFFLIFTLFSSAFAHSVDTVEDETLVGGNFNNIILYTFGTLNSKYWNYHFVLLQSLYYVDIAAATWQFQTFFWIK